MRWSRCCARRSRRRLDRIYPRWVHHVAPLRSRCVFPEGTHRDRAISDQASTNRRVFVRQSELSLVKDVL